MRTALLLLVASLAACSRKPAPPATPAPAALAVELATYKQVLVLIAPETAENFARAAKFKGADNVGPGDFKEVYAHGESLVSGSTVAVMLAYSGAWLLPMGAAARPMTPPQYLRTFMGDEEAARAVLITPKGTLIISREQTLDVLLETTKASAAPADLPYAVIHASK